MVVASVRYMIVLQVYARGNSSSSSTLLISSGVMDQSYLTRNKIVRRKRFFCAIQDAYVQRDQPVLAADLVLKMLVIHDQDNSLLQISITTFLSQTTQ